MGKMVDFMQKKGNLSNNSKISYEINKLKKRIALVAMSGILAFSGVGLKDDSNILHEDHHNHVESIDLTDYSKAVSNVNQFSESDINLFESIDLSNYSGNSLIEALKTNGYPTNEEFISKLFYYYSNNMNDKTLEEKMTLLDLMNNYFEIVGYDYSKINNNN